MTKVMQRRSSVTLLKALKLWHFNMRALILDAIAEYLATQEVIREYMWAKLATQHKFHAAATVTPVIPL